MEITFKYNNKIYSTPNLEKKLKRMKLSLEDIEIIETPVKKEIQEEDNEEKEQIFYFINEDTGYRHCSVYDKCPDGYVKCDYERYYNKPLQRKFRITKNHL